MKKRCQDQFMSNLNFFSNSWNSFSFWFLPPLTKTSTRSNPQNICFEINTKIKDVAESAINFKDQMIINTFICLPLNKLSSRAMAVDTESLSVNSTYANPLGCPSNLLVRMVTLEYNRIFSKYQCLGSIWFWCGSGSWIFTGKKWIQIQIRIQVMNISLRFNDLLT